MSETATESTQDGNKSGDTSAAQFEPITSQEEFDKALSKRLERERAKFSDYDELRAKAGQLDALAEASQTETERAAKAASKAQAERDDARAEAMRLRVAVEHGISLDDADLFLTGKDEETLRAQAQRLSDREADRKKQGNRVPSEGTNTTASSNQDAIFAANLLGGGD